VRIQETGAEIRVSEMPTIEADPTQIRQLLQNLIGNALKYYRQDTPPVVEISGEIEKGAEGTVNGTPMEPCRLLVWVNGIGFEPGGVRPNRLEPGRGSP
jgi:light-regulated signal transduction histidine kinase (bacteriophytochrome)